MKTFLAVLVMNVLILGCNFQDSNSGGPSGANNGPNKIDSPVADIEITDLVLSMNGQPLTQVMNAIAGYFINKDPDAAVATLNALDQTLTIDCRADEPCQIHRR